LKAILIFAILTITLIPTSVAFASHIFDDRDAFAQYLDIAQLTAEKYLLVIDEKTYDIYYGYHGSFEVDVEKLGEELPKLESMSINTERKSFEVTMESVPAESVLWFRLPLEVISADEAKYQLLVDGVDTKYDLTKFPEEYAIGMIIPKDTKHIEIIGTNVIPEFGALSITILTISFIGIIYAARSRFGSLWTRIN
jgi:predicted secreted protein with PEFG-CTERM motif